MECPICFEPLEGCRILKLRCGHCMHPHCAKDWYTKSKVDAPTCPMCRGKFVFKGHIDTLARWDDIKYQSQESTILEEFVEAIFERMDQNMHQREFWLDYLRDTYVLYHVMTVLEFDEEDIEDVLWNDEWISPKVVTRMGSDWGCDCHVTEKPTKYPHLLKFTPFLV